MHVIIIEGRGLNKRALVLEDDHVSAHIDITVQVDTQRGNKQRGPWKCIETLTASGVGVLHEVVKLFLRF